MATGCVIDIGYSSTTITPVFDAQVIHHSITTIPIGAADIDNYLHKLLKTANIDLELEDCTLIKELYANCSLSSKGALQYKCADYKLPSGKIINLSNTPSVCCECLFDPSIISKDCLSIQEAVHYTIQQSAEVEKRGVLWDSLMLVGGTSLIKGLKSRVEREIVKIMPVSEVSHEFQPKDAKFIHLPEYVVMYNDAPNLSSFLGGSIVSKVLYS